MESTVLPLREQLLVEPLGHGLVLPRREISTHTLAAGAFTQLQSFSMERPAARNFLIAGRVQGVGFRAFAQKAAREVGITGWARNLADGRVEVHANGTHTQLDALEARLHQGPPWSDVRIVEATAAAPFNTSGFEIR